VAVVVCSVNQRWHRPRLEVAEAVADADRLDPGWRFEDIEAQRQFPPPERNSALQVLKVQSLIPPLWPRPPRDGDGKMPAAEEEFQRDTPEPERQLDEQYARWSRGALTRARPALEEARRLADMPEGRYPIRWAADFDSTPYPWNELRHRVASLLSVDGMVRDQDGDPGGALVTARALVNLGRSLGDEPFFRGPEDRTACRLYAVSAIQRTLAQGQPSQDALAATQEAVRGEDAVPLLLPYFRGHRALTHRFLTQVDDGKRRLSEWG
jgi:hypothetical protein